MTVLDSIMRYNGFTEKDGVYRMESSDGDSVVIVSMDKDNHTWNIIAFSIINEKVFKVENKSTSIISLMCDMIRTIETSGFDKALVGRIKNIITDSEIYLCRENCNDNETALVVS